ncbi:MAG: hypothetical protein WCD35_16025 [Mycobacteriales bacterium]
MSPLDQQAAQLRAAVLKLKAPAVAKRAPAPRSSVFGRAAAAVPDDVRPATSRAALEARFRHVETNALMAGTTMCLVVLPDSGELPDALLRSLTLLVKAKVTVLVLGRDIQRDVPADRSRPLTVPLRPDDDLGNEWAVLALGPRRRTAFLARRNGELWDWVLTRDPVAVQRAGTAILERVPFLQLRVPAFES